MYKSINLKLLRYLSCLSISTYPRILGRPKLTKPYSRLEIKFFADKGCVFEFYIGLFGLAIDFSVFNLDRFYYEDPSVYSSVEERHVGESNFCLYSYSRGEFRFFIR